MKLVICVIFDRELNSLLLVEQNPGRGYWFPFDDIKQDENRALTAKRIANKVEFYFSLIIYLFHFSIRFLHLISIQFVSLNFVAVIYYPVCQMFKPTIY